MTDGHHKPLQFTLWQLLVLTLMLAVFLGVWKATDRAPGAFLVAIGIPLTAKLNKRDTKQWHWRHRNSMLQFLWLTLAAWYWLLAIFFCVMPVIH